MSTVRESEFKQCAATFTVPDYGTVRCEHRVRLPCTYHRATIRSADNREADLVWVTV